MGDGDSGYQFGTGIGADEVASRRSPDLTGTGTLRLSGPLHRKEVPLGPGEAGEATPGAARLGAAWQARSGPDMPCHADYAPEADG